MSHERRCPVGVELLADGRAHARVWAPRCRRVELELVGPGNTALSRVPLKAEDHGYFAGLVPNAGAGALYRFRLDSSGSFPDPASRFQPQGPHGPSEIVDPSTFPWSDAAWRGISLSAQVLYELHLGAFTPEGTCRAAIDRLPSLVDVGVTGIEVMPVADFPGRFGWGYDGVNLFAPSRLYGRPDDLRALVNGAHALGLGVILDVVYNHFGPDGCYLREFSDWYFSTRNRTEWGDALNFDGDHAAPVRELVLANAAYWVEEFHVDGVRLDATQQIYDASPRHILAEIGDTVRRAAGERGVLVMAENEPQRALLVRDPECGGYGLDAIWSDDFHHAAHVALTGHHDAYFSGYRGTAQEFVSAAKYGFLYQGEWYAWQHQRRGTPALDVPPHRFVHYLQNHDQVANSGAGGGERVHHATSPGRYRALTALLLLLPQTPMLFMGQEFAASAPFLYFADHRPELAELVRRGRGEFLAQFPSLATPEARLRLRDPADPATFTACKLDWRERDAHAGVLRLHRDLLALRRQDPVLRAQSRALDGCVVNDTAFAIRWYGGAGDRLLVVNLGGGLELEPWPEPLIAPPAGAWWSVAWSSDDTRYGGDGSPAAEARGGGGAERARAADAWRLPAESAVLFTPEFHATADR